MNSNLDLNSNSFELRGKRKEEEKEKNQTSPKERRKPSPVANPAQPLLSAQPAKRSGPAPFFFSLLPRGTVQRQQPSSPFSFPSHRPSSLFPRHTLFPARPSASLACPPDAAGMLWVPAAACMLHPACTHAHVTQGTQPEVPLNAHMHDPGCKWRRPICEPAGSTRAANPLSLHREPTS